MKNPCLYINIFPPYWLPCCSQPSWKSQQYSCWENFTVITERSMCVMNHIGYPHTMVFSNYFFQYSVSFPFPLPYSKIQACVSNMHILKVHSKNFRRLIYPSNPLITEKWVYLHDQPWYKPFFRLNTRKGISIVANWYTPGVFLH